MTGKYQCVNSDCGFETDDIKEAKDHDGKQNDTGTHWITEER